MARQDTVDDVDIWLEAWAVVAAKKTCAEATHWADRRLRDFRDRWPRRDGKDPLP